MREWLQRDPAGLWYAFCRDYPEAAGWFYENGTPR
jgi:hypothetical protein